MEGCENYKLLIACELVARVDLTRDDITSIHSILILDESEAIHELYFGDLSGAVGIEVRLHIGFRSYIMLVLGQSWRAAFVAERS